MSDNLFYNTAPPTFPLSPDPNIQFETEPAVKVYIKELENIFNNDNRIHNIAITGAFGVGKSSVIRTFDKVWTENKKKNNNSISNGLIEFISKISHKQRPNENVSEHSFLYISLGTYNDNALLALEEFSKQANDGEPESFGTEGSRPFNPDRDYEQTHISSQCGENKDVPEQLEIDGIEKRLLQQIFARFREKRLPGTNFRMIQEDQLSKKHILVFLIVFWVFVSSLLLLYTPIGRVIFRLINNDWIKKDFHSLFWLLSIIIKYRHLIHFVLYCSIIILSVVIITIFCLHLVSKIRIQGITLKSGIGEVELKKQETESYLDLYFNDIVYCLENVGNDICNTVVFEDLDRLSPEICVLIFTKLREINILINARLLNNNYIRFLYVVDDEILCRMDAPKFFDYIIPIIPVLNKDTASNFLASNLEKIKNWFFNEFNDEFNNKTNIFDEMEKAIVPKIAPFITNYRTQYVILNEFRMLLAVLLKADSSEITKDTISQILAFAIYHCFWPDDYSRLFSTSSNNNSFLFLEMDEIEIKKQRTGDLLWILLDNSCGCSLLSPNNLTFIGCPRDEIIQKVVDGYSYLYNTGKSLEKVFADLKEDDGIKISAMHRYVNNLMNSSELKEANKSVICAAIKVDIKCNNPDVGWFFEDHSLRRCLEILTDLSLTENEKNSFIAIGHTHVRNYNNVYVKCEGFKGEDNYYECLRNKNLNGSIEFTYDLLVEFCRGIPSFPSENSVVIKVGEEDVSLIESNERIIEIRNKLALV